MIVTQITNYVSAAKQRLLYQYQILTLLPDLLSAFVQGYQDLENAIYPIDQYRQLQYAYGEQLDNIGEIIGLKRNWLSDAEYKIFLYGTIAENYSDTTASTMLNIVQTVFQAANVYISTPQSPGCGPADDNKPASVTFSVGSPQTPSILYTAAEQIIQNSLGAGIRLDSIGSHDATGCFSTAGGQPWTNNFGPPVTPSETNPWPFGLGDLNNAWVGGPCASLLFSNVVQ